MTIVALDDFRSPKRPSGACRVTFFGVSFPDISNKTTRLSLSVDIADGDVQGVIDSAMKLGGLYLPNPDDENRRWFMPWPCAAVSIEPIEF